MQIWGLFDKWKDKNSGVVMESIHLHIIKEFPKVFISPRHFAEPKHFDLDVYLLMILYGVESETTHIAKIINVDWLKLIQEDPYNFFLQKACKPKDNTYGIMEDLIHDIILLVR